jgi:AcrR family transcriptional regulator
MPRAYDSPMRAAQAERTRARILDAMTAQLALGRDDFSIEQVAATAGVSVRTVYHHFPNREAQVEAVAAHLEASMGEVPPPPASLDEVPAFAERMMKRAIEGPFDPRAHVAPGVARAVRGRRRGSRDRALAAMIADAIDGDAAPRVAAALRGLIGAELGVALLDRCGLAPDDAVATQAWIVRVVVDALRRGDLPGRPPSRARSRSR